MGIKVGESNKAFRYATSFDMSTNTSLSLKFTSPSGVITTLTDLTSPTVTAPAVPVTVQVLGTLPASTYMEFKTLSTTFTEDGQWQVVGTYTDTATTPDSIYIGDEVAFTVDEGA